jgi:hypothetical protein
LVPFNAALSIIIVFSLVVVSELFDKPQDLKKADYAFICFSAGITVAWLLLALGVLGLS